MEKYILYLKTSPLGLKYLGKTTKDPSKYIGSGKIWLRHLKKHGISTDEIKTEILFETDNLEEFKIKSKEISIKLNIVESEEFANLKMEEGDGGDTSKHINYDNPVFHKKGRADHLNGVGLTEGERKKIFTERSKLIDYSNPERIRKIKDNTDWKKLIENRNTDYSKFLNIVHEKNKKPVLQLDLEGNIIMEHKSATDAVRYLNAKKYSSSTITNCCKGKGETALGYKWKYKK
jgi:hypothetical protein